MPKAKTTQKPKPVKKTAHKTFHKHVVDEPVTTDQESDSQTAPPTSETVIQPESQSEEETVTTSPQPEKTEERENPITSELTSPKEDVTTPSIADDAPTIDTDEPELTQTTEKPQQPTPSPIMDENEGKSKKPLIFVVIIAVILVALGSLYYLYTKKLITDSAKSSPTPISQTAQSPKPSTQSLNKTDWTLEVLNGSSKKGAAAALSEKLTAKGYQVIKTANNPEDFATSQVFFSDKTKDQADLFLEDIKGELPNPTNAGSLSGSTASARIIIGAE